MNIINIKMNIDVRNVKPSITIFQIPVVNCGILQTPKEQSEEYPSTFFSTINPERQKNTYRKNFSGFNSFPKRVKGGRCLIFTKAYLEILIYNELARMNWISIVFFEFWTS